MAWDIDAAHSHVHFAVRQMAATPIRGRFAVVHGYLHADEENPMHSWVDTQIDAQSINTGSPKRDAYLRSREFLDVAKYPLITFKSSRIEHVDSQVSRMSGDLTLHGVTRPVTFSVEFLEHGDTDEPQRATLTGRTRLTCADFDLTIPQRRNRVATGDGATSDDAVTLVLDLTLVSRIPVYQTRS